ncbi:hypothetical protein [Corynebacterium sp. CCM 9203]|uniref:hypothetical protein n=1 Tax=Corynebacterium sp. CCM 9203 TaxID=3057615 RepID=UPI003525FD22
MKSVRIGEIVGFGPHISAYSSAPGLGDLGRQHAQIFAGATGSADDVLAVFREQAQWLAEALHSTARAMETIDGVTHIQLVTGAPGPDLAPADLPFPDRPAADYRPFTFNIPAIGGGGTLAGLAAAFSTTNTAAADRATDTWNQIATHTGEIADELDAIAAQIRDLTEGESFEQAAHTITTVADSARVFSGNARIMGNSIAGLNPINSWAQAEIALAQAEIALIEEPTERAVAEKVWVSSFLGGRLPSVVSSAVPPISHLMEPAAVGHSGNTGTGSRPIGIPDAAPSITGGAVAGAGGGTAGQIESAQASGAGVLHPSEVGTSASGQGGTPPVRAGSMAGTAGGSGGGLSPVVSAAHSGTGTGTGVSTGAGTGGGTVLSPGHTGTGAGVVNAQGAGVGTGGAVRSVSGPVGGYGTGVGGGSSRGGAGVAGGVSPRSGVPGGLGGQSTGTISGGQGQTAGGAQSAGVGRGGVAGGVPMAGAGAGGGRDRRKPSAVLSQVERSGNLEKILGPAPLTVPPVIGDWARTTPPETQ